MDIITPLDKTQITGIRGITTMTVKSELTASAAGKFAQVLESETMKAGQPTSANAERDEVNLQFEKMVLSQLLGEIFKEQAEGAFGEGIQGDFHISLFADAVSEELVQNGGLGIAKFI